MSGNPSNSSRLVKEPNGSNDDMEYFVSGKLLDASLVNSLEENLIEVPSDLKSRLLLLGYYDKNSRGHIQVQQLMKHTMWMIDNRPSDYVCYYLRLDADYSVSQFLELKEHWLQMIRLNPADDRIIGNFGSAIIQRDRVLAEECFRKARTINPKEPRWARRLAKMYRNEAMNGQIEDRAKFAALAVQEAALALRLKDTQGEHTSLLMEITPLAIEFKFLEEARTWSHELLKFGLTCTFRLWAQTAWLFLARIEIIEGRVAKSQTLLKKAMKSINTEETSHIVYGANMVTLLEKLLECGERDLVINALRVCVDRCPEEFPKEQKSKADLLKWLSLIEEAHESG